LHVSEGLAADPQDELPRILRKPRDDDASNSENHDTWRLAATVLLPFAAGYFLSYLYRTINALIADTLVGEFGLSAGDLGVLTAALFLTFGAIQLPLGAWLDRFGPRRVQAVLLSIAAIGAAVFACADDFPMLVIGRALIGLGVAAALMAGLKALVLWWPAEHIALANGWLIALGTLGAVAATAPAEMLVVSIGWRGLFVLLAALSLLAALLILRVVPERAARSRGAEIGVSTTIRTIFRDARFWRLAPLSATTIGSAWALQGLWAGPWLADVEGLPRGDVVMHLLAMGIALSASALILGTAGDRLRKRGISLSTTFAVAAGIALLAQLALVLRWPLPPWLPWIAIAGIGAATVLSYAILTELFPKSASGRANGALNLLHIGAAFAMQVGVGLVVDLWPAEEGRHPAIAYQAAFGIVLALQAIAFLWFVRPTRHAVHVRPLTAHPIHTLAAMLGVPAAVAIPYLRAREDWRFRHAIARRQVSSWRSTALTSVVVMATMVAALATLLSTSWALPHPPQAQVTTNGYANAATSAAHTEHFGTTTGSRSDPPLRHRVSVALMTMLAANGQAHAPATAVNEGALNIAAQEYRGVPVWLTRRKASHPERATGAL
jgi:MFS family permease